MPDFNFDKISNRRGTASFKWDKYPEDCLPMFVADMDFETPEPIVSAMKQRLNHPYFGYSMTPASLLETIGSMLVKKYAFQVDKETIVLLPCLVSALSTVARIAAAEGHNVIVPTPCYPPFIKAPRHMRAKISEVQLDSDSNGRTKYSIEALDRAADEGGKYIFLCNPHNPTGRVFSEEELRNILDWAERRDVIIVSDEIHCELILDKTLRHIPIATLSPAAAKRTITLMAPSKTYNIPGIGIGFAVIQDATLRSKFIDFSDYIVPSPNILSLHACEVAYKDCESWRLALLDYLRENRDLVCKTLEPYREIIQFTPPEGTYLAWIDVRKLGWEKPQAEIINRAQLVLSDGFEFHKPGFVRLNFACPKETLHEGLNRFVSLL